MASSFWWSGEDLTAQQQGSLSYTYSGSGGFILGGVASIGPITYIPATNQAGLVFGGVATSSRGIVPVPSGGLIYGGQATIVLFTHFNTYLWFGGGGLIYGGAATIPQYFLPDRDFSLMSVDNSGWVLDITFPGEQIGGS